MIDENVMTDDMLVKAYANGNNNAFNAILRRHQGKVFAYILRVVKNEDIANDIFQETFVKAIITIRQGKYSETGRFSAWIIRIAHNLIIDFYRQEKSENLRSCDNEDVDILNRKELSENTIEDIIVNDQIREDVKQLVEMLPNSQREVLQMRFYQGLSFKEIAESTGVSINTALGRMRYAILNMRKMAREQEIELTV